MENEELKYVGDFRITIDVKQPNLADPYDLKISFNIPAEVNYVLFQTVLDRIIKGTMSQLRNRIIENIKNGGTSVLLPGPNDLNISEDQAMKIVNSLHIGDLLIENYKPGQYYKQQEFTIGIEDEKLEETDPPKD